MGNDRELTTLVDSTGRLTLPVNLRRRMFPSGWAFVESYDGWPYIEVTGSPMQFHFGFVKPAVPNRKDFAAISEGSILTKFDLRGRIQIPSAFLNRIGLSDRVYGCITDQPRGVRIWTESTKSAYNDQVREFQHCLTQDIKSGATQDMLRSHKDYIMALHPRTVIAAAISDCPFRDEDNGALYTRSDSRRDWQRISFMSSLDTRRRFVVPSVVRQLLGSYLAVFMDDQWRIIVTRESDPAEVLTRFEFHPRRLPWLLNHFFRFRTDSHGHMPVPDDWAGDSQMYHPNSSVELTWLDDFLVVEWVAGEHDYSPESHCNQCKILQKVGRVQSRAYEPDWGVVGTRFPYRRRRRDRLLHQEMVRHQRKVFQESIRDLLQLRLGQPPMRAGDHIGYIVQGKPEVGGVIMVHSGWLALTAGEASKLLHS